MESVEVWMWLIAGIMIGGIVFTSAFMFLTRQTVNMEAQQADDSFSKLKTTMDMVCVGGRYSQELFSITLPNTVSRIYIEDDNGIKGVGSYLCIEMADNEPSCQELEICSASMHTVELQHSTDLFYFFRKAMGQKKPSKITFTIIKSGQAQINATWRKTIAD